MGDRRFEIETWDARSPEVVGRALVLPGRAYTVDHPLLFWPGQVLADAGWQVTTVRWWPDVSDLSDPRPFVEAAAEALEARAPSAERTLLVTKSLSSHLSRWAAARDYPGIWLTPVLTDDHVAEGLDECSVGLTVGGTADHLWDADRARATGLEVLELPEADHVLHVPGEWERSIAALRAMLARVEAFAGGLVTTPLNG